MRFQRLTSEHESESRQRRKGEDKAMELEQKLTLSKVEQKEVIRKYEDLQDTNKMVRGRGVEGS